MTRVLVAGLLATMAPSQATACETTLPYHIRIQDCRLAATVEDARARSSTLNDLIDRVQRAPALVFVVPAPNSESASKLLGGLFYDVYFSGGYRMIRIFVARNTGDAAVATFGHELRHALELLEATGTKDDLQPEAPDGRTAWHAGPHTIETQAALDAGSAIRRELRAAKRRRSSSNEELAP